MSDIWAVIVVALPLIAMWLAALVEVARRRDLDSARRAIWIAVLIVVPVIALAVYVVVRPPRAVRLSGGRADQARAETIVALAERRQRGEIDDSTYRTEVRAVARA